jgi:AcrR family transcriptional regulator
MSTGEPLAGSRRRPGTAVLDKGRRRAAAALDAATALLAEEGAAGLSTRKVAARAGMRAGNLQYYFRTREDLVRALLERYLARSRERVAARLTALADRPPAERLAEALEEILEDQAEPGDCALFRELWAMASHDAEVAAALAAFYRGYVGDVAAMLGAVAPDLAEDETRRIATLVVAMLEGLSVVRDAATDRETARRRLAADLAAATTAMLGLKR